MPPRRRTTNPIIGKRLADAYTNGTPVSDLAEQFGISEGQVSRLAVKHGAVQRLPRKDSKLTHTSTAPAARRTTPRP